MGKIIGGSFQGTGAALYLCLGFVPDFIEINNHDDPGSSIRWYKHMMDDDGNVAGGLHFEYGVATQNELGAASGVRPYYGGATLTSSDVGTTTYGEGVYLKHEPKDYRYGTDKAPGGGSGDAVSDTIDTWTLDTSANRTGHFNEDVTGTYIGPGSPIMIDGKWYKIISLTASQGESDDEVTLNDNPASGDIGYIGGQYGAWVPMTAGEVTKEGIRIDEATNVNVDGERCSFIAMVFDN